MRRPTHPYIRLKNEFVYLAVTLDGYSRKVVGWALERTLASPCACPLNVFIPTSSGVFVTEQYRSECNILESSEPA